jgi:hypothetical protein
VNKHIKKLTTCFKHTLYDFLEIDLSITFQSIDRQWSLCQIAFSIHITHYTPKNIDDLDIFFRNIAEQMLREQTVATCVSNAAGCLIGTTSKLDEYSRTWLNFEQAFVLNRSKHSFYKVIYHVTHPSMLMHLSICMIYNSPRL